MARRALILVPLLAFMVASGSAQDARAVLQASATAMGLNNLKDDQYSGTGWNALVGQSFNLTEDWPRFEVTAYSRTIDYDAKRWGRGFHAAPWQLPDAGWRRTI